MKLWAGRFQKETDTLVNDFNSSIQFDARLYKQDIAGSIAHAQMLGKQGIIEEHEVEQIVEGLKAILADIEAGRAYYDLVEVMTCKTGCVGGAGQPYGLKQKKQERTAGLYAADRSAPFKRAEYNPVVTSMMDAYTPDQRHDLLHVDYTK